MICKKFDWNWPVGSGEDFFLLNIYFQFIFTLCYYLPLGKGVALSLGTNVESPSSLRTCAKSGYIWPCGSGEEIENVKVGRPMINNAYLSFQLRPLACRRGSRIFYGGGGVPHHLKKKPIPPRRLLVKQKI
jgi:hypothetical protein